MSDFFVNGGREETHIQLKNSKTKTQAVSIFQPGGEGRGGANQFNSIWCCFIVVEHKRPRWCSVMQHTVSKSQQIAFGPRLMLWPVTERGLALLYQLLSANCMAGAFFFFQTLSPLCFCVVIFLQWKRTPQGFCVKAFSLEADERCCKSLHFSIRTKETQPSGGGEISCIARKARTTKCTVCRVSSIPTHTAGIC